MDLNEFINNKIEVKSMKYLIMEDFSGSAITFLFPDKVDHVDMREQLPYGKVLSAGSVSIQNNKFVCTEGSRELNVSARPEDVQIIAESFEKTAS